MSRFGIHLIQVLERRSVALDIKQLREQAHRASDGTRGYIRDEPLKSMLFAAATGAAIMAKLHEVAQIVERDYCGETARFKARIPPHLHAEKEEQPCAS